MTTADLRKRLGLVANVLVSVSGTLMYVAMSNGRCAAEPDIHEENCSCIEDCSCIVCRASVATQAAATELEAIIRELEQP